MGEKGLLEGGEEKEKRGKGGKERRKGGKNANPLTTTYNEIILK